jgi:hypothetical protein
MERAVGGGSYGVQVRTRPMEWGITLDVMGVECTPGRIEMRKKF